MKAILLLIAAQTTVGIGELTPLVTADGAHRFELVAQPPKKVLKDSGMSEDDWINRTLERLLAEHHWCLDGWEITNRGTASGFVTIQGRCR